MTTTNKITVRQWAEQYLELFKRRPDGGVRPSSSWDHDRRCLEFYILPHIGGRALTSLRLHELEDLVACSTKRDGITPLAGATRQLSTHRTGPSPADCVLRAALGRGPKPRGPGRPTSAVVGLK